jgi:hypothetical protein
MFSLEQSITEWRKQMLAVGIKSPELEELESHLREEMDRQIKFEMSEQKVFEISVTQIGRPQMIKSEFNKIERNIMKRSVIILLGIFGVLFGPGVFLPALAAHNKMGIWSDNIVWPMVVGAVITIVGMGVTVFGFKKRQA